MKTFSANWWTLNVPDDACIRQYRDYTAITTSEEPDIEVRLSVLRGESLCTTAEDLESYAGSFYDGMQDRTSVERNGWAGFTFTHVDPKSGQVSCRGYFAKKRYLTIVSVDKPTTGGNSSRKCILDLIERLEVKVE